MRLVKILVLLSCWWLTACGGGERQTFWIYTSVYKEVYPLFEPGLEEAFPDVDFQWYQSGSEKIAAKILAEERGGKIQADLLMTSDLFFYQELVRLGWLLPLSSKTFDQVPAEYRDHEGHFAINRLPLMVIAYNQQVLPAGDVPEGFADLIDPKYKGRVTMPSPLESGSALSTALYLYHLFDEAYFDGLRQVEVLAAGGNGATLSRIQSGERPVGIVLLENVLKAEQLGLEAVAWKAPKEGALAIPAPLAVLEDTADPELAQRVVDWFLSEEARKIVIEGWVHSIFTEDPAPFGAPPLSELDVYPWDLDTLATWGEKRQDVKSLFQRVVLE